MFIYLTAPVYSQGWNICRKKGIKCFFRQPFGPTSCHSLQKCWPHTALLPAAFELQILCQTRRGHLHLPLDASLGCKSMVCVCLVQQTEFEQRHRVSRKLGLFRGRECVLSDCLSPGLMVPSSLLVQEIQVWLPDGLLRRDEEGLWMDSGSQGSQPKGKTV